MTTIVDQRGNTVVRNPSNTLDRVSSQTFPDGGFLQFNYTPASSSPITQTDDTDARGFVARHQFNAAHLLTCRTEARGTAKARTATFEYQSGTNLLTATVDPLLRCTEMVYDARGNVATVRTLAGPPSQMTETFTDTSDWNLLSTATDAPGKSTRYFYDSRGRLTEGRDALKAPPASSTTTGVWSAASSTRATRRPSSPTT